MASLLAEHRVPVAVLNACQSAMQDASEAGLAQRLAEAGVPVAVGMAYSVTVSAAEQAMPVLYGRIADGAELTAAVHAARRHLYEHKARRAYFGQQLDLEDWMLPVMFAQQPLHIDAAAYDRRGAGQFFDRAAAVGDEPATEYGFVGRDLDIQAIEHRLLAERDSNQLLVQGMAGAGKSTLLAHLAWWWQRTGLVHAGVPVLLRGPGLDQRPDHPRDPRPAAVPRPSTPTPTPCPSRLRSSRSPRCCAPPVTCSSWTTPNQSPPSPPPSPTPCPPPNGTSSRLSWSRLRGGRTLVLLGSREHETWLTNGSTGPGIYELPGLDPQAASVLVERILHRHHATRYLSDTAERGALQELVTLLGGYPLPLTVVLPVLAAAPPSAVLADLKTGGPGADPAGLISRAIEYSHGKLDPALQNSLLLLAPFTAVIPTGPILDAYRDLLLEHEAVTGAGPGRPGRRPEPGCRRRPGHPPPSARLPGPGPAGPALLPAQPPARPAGPAGRRRPGPLPALRATSRRAG